MRGRTRSVVIAFVLLSTTSADAQYRNYEAQPNGYGGYTGTYGNRNFDTGTGSGDGAQVGGRRPGVIKERGSVRRGSVGATQRNCVVDANGNAFCR